VTSNKFGGLKIITYHCTMDLFEQYETLPEEVQAILLTFEDETYSECRRLERELKPYGYTFDWGLDAQPFNLHKIDLEVTN
jgi:hypothetical protein